MTEIRQVWRGYDPAQVDVGLNVLEAENERLKGRLADATEEVEFLRGQRTDRMEESDEIARVLVLAERTASAVREDAYLEAEVIRSGAEAELASVRHDIAAAKRQLGDLHKVQVDLGNGDASDVATRIALIIDGEGGVGAESAAAQRMLEFAELLHLGPRGEPMFDEHPVPRKVEVPARINTTPASATATKGTSLDSMAVPAPVAPVAPAAREPLDVAAAEESTGGGVPAPARGIALTETADTLAKPPLATRRKRVIRKSVDETAKDPVS